MESQVEIPPVELPDQSEATQIQEAPKGKRKAPLPKYVPPEFFKSVPEGVTRYENYELRVVKRTELKNAPYNPRQMSEAAKKKLRDNLRKRGLMQPPIWNEKTGNIVGGHQRVNILDAMEGNKDYSLRVAVVNLDEAVEKEQNVFLNNPIAQGDWDLEKLGVLLATPDIKIDETGFDMGTVYQLFGENPLSQTSERLTQLSDQLRTTQEAIQAISARLNVEDDMDYYVVAVFSDNTSKTKFFERLGITNAPYIDGRILADKLTGVITTDEASYKAADDVGTTGRISPIESTEKTDTPAG